MLIELVDGAIKEIYTDTLSYDGCETCDYGSSYINEFIVYLTSGALKCKVKQMYDYALSEDYLMKLFLQNVDKIKEKTEDSFIKWLKRKMAADAKEGSWLDGTEVEFDFEPIQGEYR